MKKKLNCQGGLMPEKEGPKPKCELKDRENVQAFQQSCKEVQFVLQ